MPNNLLKRQMACMMAGSDVDCIMDMQSMVLHYLIQSEGQGNRFQRDIETQFAMRCSTATGILQLMEQHGLLYREQIVHDARLKRLVLTEKARALNAEIHKGLEKNRGTYAGRHERSGDSHMVCRARQDSGESGTIPTQDFG